MNGLVSGLRVESLAFRLNKGDFRSGIRGRAGTIP